MKLSTVLTENIEKIKSVILADDVIFYEFTACQKSAVMIYAEDLSDKVMIGKLVVSPLQNAQTLSNFNDFKKVVNLPESDELTTTEEVVEKILAGDGVCLVDGIDKGVSVATRKPASRAVTEPPTASILKGPREGFVENAQINMS